MRNLFPALKKRFDCDVYLKRIGRKLYLGTAGDQEHGTLPWVECHCVGIDHDDTFGEDIELRLIEFTIKSGSSLRDKCLDILDHMMRVFDDGTFEGEDIQAVDADRDGGSGPDLVDGVYEASLSYTFRYHRDNQWPLTRWAVNG